MNKYDIESLKAINASYDSEHRVMQYDVDKANSYAKVIEETRNKDFPMIGDIVEYTDKYGDYYRNAHIEQVHDNELHIVERPYEPFITVNVESKRYYTSTSGGAWAHIPKKLKLIGTREKSFVDWGHCGACGNGAIRFYANVNVWECIETDSEYTTRTHDKFYMTISKQLNSHDYKYIITKGSQSHTAFRTDEEYQAWLKTFHGIEVIRNYNIVVWTFKQEEKCVPLKDYLKIDNAIIDSTMDNGDIQECKRIYEGTTVTTYIPHQNDRIKLEGVPRYMNAYK